jgi:hypothetical protein
MSDEGKIDKTKDALRQFTKKLGNTSAIAMQTFSDRANERVPFGFYKDQKANVQSTIESLAPEGATVTRQGFTLALDRLKQAIDSKKFPGYHFVLILLTDGVPETTPPRTCLKQVPDPLWGPDGRCFTQAEDPRNNPNIPDQIKNLGAAIYTIGIYSNESSDVAMKPELSAMLQQVSTQPASAHYFESLDAQNLNTIFKSVISQICTNNITDPNKSDVPGMNYNIGPTVTGFNTVPTNPPAVP